MELTQLEDLFSQPGWILFQDRVRNVLKNSDVILHSPGRKDDREFYAGKCAGVIEILNEVDKIKILIDAEKLKKE